MSTKGCVGAVVACLAGLAGLAAFQAGCGDDVVAHSETVSVKLSGIKEGDPVNGVASVDKNINTEEGNPYGDFLKDAKDALGRDPSDVEVRSVVVKVHPESKDVTQIDQVFADLEVFLSTAETVVTIGKVTSVSGSEMNIPVIEDIDYEPVRARMLDGNFKMGVRGTTNVTLPAKYELKLVLDVRFRALE